MMKRCYISYSSWIALQFTVTFCSFLNMSPYWWTLFFSVPGTDYLYLAHSTMAEILQCELHKALCFQHPKTDYFSFASWKSLTGMYIFVCHDITKGKRAAWIGWVAIQQLGAWSWWWWSWWWRWWRWDESYLGYSSNPNAFCILANWFGHNRASYVELHGPFPYYI